MLKDQHREELMMRQMNMATAGGRSKSFMFGCCSGPRVAEANGFARGSNVYNSDIMISELGDS